MNCSIDYDHEFWNGFDGVMYSEWNITTSTNCLDVNDLDLNRTPTTWSEYRAIVDQTGVLSTGDNAAEISTISSATEKSLPVTNFTGYFDAVLSRAAFESQQEEANQKQTVFLTEYSKPVFQRIDATGIAYVDDNMAFVKNNYQYSTGTLSHEILHLVLEEEGYGKNCYVDKVHENQFYYSVFERGKYHIVQKFDC